MSAQLELGTSPIATLDEIVSRLHAEPCRVIDVGHDGRCRVQFQRPSGAVSQTYSSRRSMALAFVAGLMGNKGEIPADERISLAGEFLAWLAGSR